MTRSTRRLALTPAGAAYLEKCRVILNLVEVAESDLAAEHHAARGHIRASLPYSFGLARLGPLLLEFATQNPGVSLEIDYSDRSANLISEGIDLSIRITRRLAPGDVARRLGSCRMKVVASPAYIARHGRPRTPAELAGHEFLGYSLVPGGALPFIIDGKLQNIAVHSRLTASSGEWLTEAAARGMGLTCHPDFIVDPYIARGSVVQVLEEFPLPELGIYALLPSNRQVPHRVRALLDFIAARLARAREG
jgi:DNA-binding transcriptional LysR family regulator